MLQSLVGFRIRNCVNGLISCQLRRELASGQSGVDKSLLSKLRKKTGFPFINCKKALEQYDNDFEQAEKWLREQAQKEGWAKATKLQNRPMSQGLVGLIGDKQTATMIEVNCETDFVARNSKFVGLVTSLTQALQQHFTEQQEKKISLDSGSVGKVTAKDGRSLADLVALEVGNIGENMALRRAVHLRAADDTFLSSYVHLSGPALSTDSECEVGKFGAVLELQQLPESDSSSSSSESSSDSDEEELSPLSLDQVCRQLGQHVVGMNPKLVGDPSDQEKELTEQGDAKDSGSDSVDTKDSEDKVEKSQEDEDTLILQEFLLEPSVTVGQVLERNNLAVKDFVRFECGEDLGEDSS